MLLSLKLLGDYGACLAERLDHTLAALLGKFYVEMNAAIICEQQMLYPYIVCKCSAGKQCHVLQNLKA